MIIINRYDELQIRLLNETLNLDLPIDPTQYITIFNSHTDLPFKARFRAIVQAYEDLPVVVLSDNFYPSDWKLVPMITQRHTEFIYFTDETDYLYMDNQDLIQYRGNKVCRTVHRIMVGCRSKVHDMDRYLYDYLISRDFTYQQAIGIVIDIERMYLDKQIVEYVEVISRGLEFDDSLIDDIIYKAYNIDKFKFRIMNIWVYKENPSFDMIKEFSGQFQKPEAELFIKAMYDFLQIEIDLEDIWTDAEEVHMEELWLNLVALDKLQGTDYTKKYREDNTDTSDTQVSDSTIEIIDISPE